MDQRASNEASHANLEEVAERGGPIVFEDDRLRLLPIRRGGFIRYSDITHVASSRRALAIGSAGDTTVLRRREFASEAAMQALERALMDRVASLPDGEIRLARMAELDQRARSRGPRRAIYGFVAVCLLAFVAQWQDPFVTHVGSFMPGLVADGELWRIFTANFLHERLLFPLHLGLNLLCILVIGLLVERTLGSWRTVVVMGISAIGAMYGCALAGYSATIGASGVAAGLAGGLLCIELNGSHRLPVWWRIPRRVFIAALLAQAVIDYFVPFIAGAAHLGGFMAGYLVTRSFVSDSLMRRPTGLLTRASAVALIAAAGLSALALGPLLGRDGAALERHGLRLLEGRGGDANSDNELAWVMVTQSKPSDIGVQVAAALAERAVAETRRRDPVLLDTLAEVLFVAGDIPGAVIVINEAIELSGGDRYFVEQRRRYIGERAPDDRPDPPGLPRIERRPGSDPRPEDAYTDELVI